MDIIPHNPVQNYESEGFPKNNFMDFLDMLKAWFEEIDWSDYAKKEDLDALAAVVDALSDRVDDMASDIDGVEEDVTEIRSIIADLRARIEAIEAKLNDVITVVQATFTNPSYFYADNSDPEFYNIAASDKSVVCSFTGSVLQSVQVADNTLELVNINLDDNVVLDLVKTPNHFYVPMCVEHFDAQGNFTDMQTCMLDCELTQEMSGYDISCYFHGNIANVNQYTKFHFSLDFPYFVERSNNDEEI